VRPPIALLLAAGVGSRLQPLTTDCPKCLMPIGKRPILEYWLCNLFRCGLREVVVNSYHHADMVGEFLSRPVLSSWVTNSKEDELLGTAGTLRAHAAFYDNRPVLLIHADNWCQCNFQDFLDFHACRRPAGTLITMMTFRTPRPETCGIVGVSKDGVVTEFFEKAKQPRGNLANGAVYVIEPQVISWLKSQPSVTDFSTEVIPKFLGKIATWENTGIHRDIGTLEMLHRAQYDPRPDSCWPSPDAWTSSYLRHPIHHHLRRLIEDR